MSVQAFEAIWKLAALVFAAGAVWQELKAIRKDIARLEEKQDKHNAVIERTYKLEQKVEDLEKRIK